MTNKQADAIVQRTLHYKLSMLSTNPKEVYRHFVLAGVNAGLEMAARTAERFFNPHAKVGALLEMVADDIAKNIRRRKR